MKVLFMGTPDFAKTAFERLCDNKFELVGAVTQPDKPKGRGYLLMPPPVKEAALSHGIQVLQPQTLKNEEFKNDLKRLSPDVIVVAAYGKLLPNYVLNTPKYGCVNIHASLLPRWRGAAPIQRCIMAGDKKTGITTMLMDEGLDTGDILESSETEISDTDNFETLHNRLSMLGAELIVSTLRKIENGKRENLRRKQSNENTTYAAKIEKSDCVINFEKSNVEIFNTIRALSPSPLSYSMLHGKRIKFTEAKLPSATTEYKNAVPGTVVSVSEGIITVKCGKGNIEITGVLPEGKKRTPSADFIRGRGICEGDLFTPIL
ncbi:MAG: methionyl-tRNA formyltransferase [Oscillospiraceae bacterium]|jgi:methionyl-tRNA formyltransferase|nr:MAG: methionyl-tRNA formyltransferase [Oscillospiraceae bacterium]